MHIETRFHRSELRALDRFATTLGLSREEALREAVARQARRLGERQQKPLSFLARFWQVFSIEPASFSQLEQSEIVVDHYPNALGGVARDLKRRSGCRTQFAVPRYALAAELQEQGEAVAFIPLGFGAQAFL